jgi:hypothetical protein
MDKIFRFMFTAFLVSLSGQAWAANYSDPIDGTFKGIYGDTISIEVPSLVSKSPDTNQDEDGILSFRLNADTAYSNFNQLTDLKYGDAVRIDYNEDPTGKTKEMIADKITKLGSEIVANPVDTTNSIDATAAPVTQTITTTTTRVNTQ